MSVPDGLNPFCRPPRLAVGILRRLLPKDLRIDIHWKQHPDENELYDLEEDPYEMNNVIEDPAREGILMDLRDQMGTAVLEAMGLRR